MAMFTTHGMDLVGKIMALESGEMSPDEAVKFFSELITSGTISGLQGSYQRTARQMVDGGYLGPKGNVLKLPSDDE